MSLESEILRKLHYFMKQNVDAAYDETDIGSVKILLT